MRLDKAVALAGYSRSEARAMIARGRVRVRGEIARDAGLSVQIADVSLDGAPLGAEAELYLMLNKPAGVITATEDPRLPTVVSLLPEKYRRRKIGPVGRLDRDVTGLVLLTTDGQLAHRLISPRWKAEKCYRARCEGALGEADARAFAAGIPLGDFTARPAEPAHPPFGRGICRRSRAHRGQVSSGQAHVRGRRPSADRARTFAHRLRSARPRARERRISPADGGGNRRTGAASPKWTAI